MGVLSVLLVEDNADDEVLTRRALEKSTVKSEVAVVRDGAEALDYLFCRGAYTDHDKGDLPSLILLDLKLPKIGGVDVLKQIRADESTRYLPVVVLTSSREEKDLMACYGNGANSYVVKPVDLKQFTDVIQQLSVYWAMLNESLQKKF